MDEFNELLKEYKEQRDALKDMIADLEKLRSNVDKIFPENFDSRYKFLFEEKIKAAVELFKVIVDMRKEISKSVKDEIEIRRKLILPKIGDEEIKDIRDLAREVEKLTRLDEQSGTLKGVST